MKYTFVFMIAVNFCGECEMRWMDKLALMVALRCLI